MTIGLIVLGLVLPAMIAVGAAIWCLDGRPIVLWQPRMGRQRRVFAMPKFRTMRVCAGGCDRDVTRLGRYLRRYRLDELPQLFSVLAGDMSIVGPRPELVAVVRSTYQARHLKRFAAIPGVTGLWQIRATRQKPIHHNIGYDLAYIRSASACMDLKIAMKTLTFIVAPRSDQT